MPSLRFPKQARLLTPRDYSGVFDQVTARVAHRHLLILATPNQRSHARVGLIFSKKNLRRAVDRNRVKRLVRESFRHQTTLPAMDIVVLGRKGLAGIDNARLHRILDELWQRLEKKASGSGQHESKTETGSR
ncbi:ribonuclease P protein component [Tamilnaduibacter salinus]|uniref:Ribonuclease P protein component n=1 Tax=Tamilnaduibacter salinus TaxID=1484056 RepID=A0A2A2I5M3_9GAMM|nr:ribonuclease P protein component [Tamilnaduibacter salinus]PAV26882.1 ribonuclease P protein component [Tamilnaduibacter salinus]PVY77467.1 ribonuclease P protein component [Tamilnaduibacter salinus]